MRSFLSLCLPALVLCAAPALADPIAGGAGQGALPYDSFEPGENCAECHDRFARQHEASLMAQSFTHIWDEVEYFTLALPHARMEPKVAEVEAGCNGCHAPLAYLAGDIPPQRPEAGTRANEGVSCDLCHAIVGFEGEVPFNFNWIVDPGEVKQGARPGLESDYHGIAVNPFLKSAEFCGTCHNEKDPYGMWVKSTHIEWRDGPYGASGITCQGCHMPAAGTELVADGEVYPDARQHTFHGVHYAPKVTGSVEVLLYPEEAEVAPGERLQIGATVMNAKAGHMIPSGSVEERVVWLHVEARDSAGGVHHLPVDLKGFDGEAWTVADPGALAYQAMGEIQGLADFSGLPRDGDVPAGDRIYRMPYLDPQGRMTIAQWYTASFGPDYRLPPLAAIDESFTWALPADLPAGPVEVTASVYMTMVVSSVADHLGLPASEREPMLMGRHTVTVAVR